MKIPMPVASAILRGSEIDDSGTNFGLPSRAGSIRSSVSKIVKVDAQVACDLFWSSNSYFDNRDEYPPTRLPYPTLWLEWSHTHPKVGVNVNYFALLRKSDPQQWKPMARKYGWKIFMNDRIEEVISVIGGVLAPTGPVVFPCDAIACIDSDGALIVNDKGTPLSIIGPTDQQELTGEIGSGLAKPALLAVGLMNTKNVKMSDESTSTISPKQARRSKIPRFEYRVIELPHSKVSGGRGERHGRKVDTARHLVRGHFKTYTADAPLMGKHIGTYWWAHQVRGNQEHGVIVSDYSLKEQFAS